MPTCPNERHQASCTQSICMSSRFFVVAYVLRSRSRLLEKRAPIVCIDGGERETTTTKTTTTWCNGDPADNKMRSRACLRVCMHHLPLRRSMPSLSRSYSPGGPDKNGGGGGGLPRSFVAGAGRRPAGPAHAHGPRRVTHAARHAQLASLRPCTRARGGHAGEARQAGR